MFLMRLLGLAPAETPAKTDNNEGIPGNYVHVAAPASEKVTALAQPFTTAKQQDESAFIHISPPTSGTSTKISALVQKFTERNEPELVTLPIQVTPSDEFKKRAAELAQALTVGPSEKAKALLEASKKSVKEATEQQIVAKDHKTKWASVHTELLRKTHQDQLQKAHAKLQEKAASKAAQATTPTTEERKAKWTSIHAEPLPKATPAASLPEQKPAPSPKVTPPTTGLPFTPAYDFSLGCRFALLGMRGHRFLPPLSQRLEHLGMRGQPWPPRQQLQHQGYNLQTILKTFILANNIRQAHLAGSGFKAAQYLKTQESPAQQGSNLRPTM